MENRYYVYALIDPRTNTPFYIGKGTGNRAYLHLTCKKVAGENRKKKHYIIGLRNKGLEPVVSILRQGLLESEAYSYEEKLIKQYGRKGLDKGGILTNIAFNNLPPKPKKGVSTMPLESRRRLSEKRKGPGNPAYGKRPSEIAIRKAKARKGEKHPHYGKKMPKEWVEARIASYKKNGTVSPLKGIARTKEMRNKISCTWTITDPEGHTFTVVNLNEFAKSIDVNPESLRLSSFTKAGTTRGGWRAVKVQE